MILKDIIVKADFDEVYTCLLNNYKDVRENNDLKKKLKLKKGFMQLCDIQPKVNEEGMKIVISSEEVDGLNYFDVSGMNAEDSDLYGLEFNDYDEWLGYEVECELLDKMTNSEIAAHCYWEMTYIYGWTLEDRQHNMEIEIRAQELEKELEKNYEKIVETNKPLKNPELAEFVSKYRIADTEHLKTSIEIMIEDLIKHRLITYNQVGYIKNNFAHDEDICTALERYYS